MSVGGAHLQVPGRSGTDGRLTESRFVSPAIAKKYDFELPVYEGIDQVVEVSSNGQKI